MDRIKELRDVMRKHNIDIYYIPTDDYHSSEFVGNYFKVREYISGFTGSAGTLIVTMNEAGLWTDGRYYGIFLYPYQIDRLHHFQVVQIDTIFIFYATA